MTNQGTLRNKFGRSFDDIKTQCPNKHSMLSTIRQCAKKNKNNFNFEAKSERSIEYYLSSAIP